MASPTTIIAIVATAIWVIASCSCFCWFWPRSITVPVGEKHMWVHPHILWSSVGFPVISLLSIGMLWLAKFEEWTAIFYIACCFPILMLLHYFIIMRFCYLPHHPKEVRARIFKEADPGRKATPMLLPGEASPLVPASPNSPHGHETGAANLEPAACHSYPHSEEATQGAFTMATHPPPPPSGILAPPISPAEYHSPEVGSPTPAVSPSFNLQPPVQPPVEEWGGGVLI